MTNISSASLISIKPEHNAHEDAPWILRLLDFVRTVAKSTQIRIIGICFGHQIIARALGGVVEKNKKGWEVSVDRVDLTPTGKRILNLDHLVSSLTRPLQDNRGHLLTDSLTNTGPAPNAP